MKMHTFPTIGFTTDVIPDNIKNPLLEKLKIIQEDFSKHINVADELVGHMSHEYDLTEFIPLVEPYVIDLAFKYDQQYNYFTEVTRVNSGFAPLYLKELWVNYQQKNEFNPMHNHGGVMSFVMWMTIPYSIEDERQKFNFIKGGSLASCFTFYYTNPLGTLKTLTIPVDNTWEPTICMFPAALNHSVHPFYTSDGYRVSIAGNIAVNLN